MMYLIANWKQNKDIVQAQEWIDAFPFGSKESFEIIVAPSTPFLYQIYSKARSKKIFLSAQNISQYTEGAHTGEVSVKQLSAVVKYAIIGHSETGDWINPQTIIKKINICLDNNIVPILCFSSSNEIESVRDEVDLNKCMLAFEPIESIGTGDPADPLEVEKIASKLGINKLIYGGSVNSETIVQYLGISAINGFLVGGASLNPLEFSKIAEKLINK